VTASSSCILQKRIHKKIKSAKFSLLRVKDQPEKSYKKSEKLIKFPKCIKNEKTKILSRLQKKFKNITIYSQPIKNIIIGLLDGSKSIKTQIIIKKNVKYLKKSYPTKFVDLTQNHNKMAGIIIQKFSRKNNF
jgi:hypothetical protein